MRERYRAGTNDQELKNALDQVHISEEMQEEIIACIEDRMKKRKVVGIGRGKRFAAAAAVVLAIGAAGISTRAVMSDPVKARMESMPREELEEVQDFLMTSTALADGFSRELTEAEKERMAKLWRGYRRGKFPKEKLPVLKNAEGVADETLCFVEENSSFYLPERKLTDEELLEIIDYNEIRNYALAETEHVKQCNEELQTKQKQKVEQIVQKGGISEEQAQQIAKERLYESVGELADNVTWSVGFHNITDDGEWPEEYYVVGRDSCGFNVCHYGIDAMDGTILWGGLLPEAEEYLRDNE